MVILALLACTPSSTPSGELAPPSPPPPLTGANGPDAGFDWSCGSRVLELDAFVEPPPTPTPVFHAACANGEEAWVDGVAYGSLAEAIENAETHALIQLCPGMHYAPFGRIPINATLEGFVADPEATVLTGRLRHAVLEPRGDLTLRRLTLRRGYDRTGAGAIPMDDGARLWIEDVVLEENVSCRVSAISVESHLRAGGLTVRRNVGVDAPVKTRAYRLPLDVVVQDSVFEDNRAHTDAGALQFQGSSGLARVRRTDFRRNYSRRGAGAMANDGTDGFEMRMDGCLFEENEGNSAGALSLATGGYDLAEVELTRFIRNTSDDGATVSINNRQGGRYRLRGLEFADNEQPNRMDCSIEVDVSDEDAFPAEVDVVGTTFQPGLGQVCAIDNVDVTVDGEPIPAEPSWQ